MGVNSLPKTVTRQRRGCDLNPGPSAPESSTLTTRLPSHTFSKGSEVVSSRYLSCFKLVFLLMPARFTVNEDNQYHRATDSITVARQHRVARVSTQLVNV